ncbi:Hypothetical predicted protein [Mytilus galloprovincialis]|uniref:B box-type domain-containing protein n=1 Tax=Mytilus galloprovincialis TaxID=29158 RepID=A0A8B6HB82_MYTGA|nr:Hypothetical predicted protein [Mytilus galloprovincialis]
MTESHKQLCWSCPGAKYKNTIDLWCFDCSESICIECKEKHLGKFHVTIPMSEAEKVDKSVITGPCTCNEKFLHDSLLHCKSHDKIYCKCCSPSVHINCSDVQSIANAASGCMQRTSVLITDLELRLSNLKTNYMSLIEEQELNLTDLNFQKYQIKVQVSDFRKDMNEYFNESEDKIGNQLDRYYEQCRAQISKNIQATLERYNVLSSFENTLHLLITNSAECRTFIAAKNIDCRQYEEESVYETFQDLFKLFKLSFLKEETNDIHTVCTTLGEVKLEVVEKQNMKDSKRDSEVQTSVRVRMTATRLYAYNSTEFDLGTDGKIVRSCLTPHKMVIIIGNARAVWTYNIIRKSIERIDLSDFPVDVSVIDDESFLVAMATKGASIVNLSTKTVQYILNYNSKCVAYHNEVIYTVRKKKLVLSNLNGSIIKKEGLGFNANGICVDSKGDVYVSDNKQICKLDSGNYRKEVVLERKWNRTCDIGGITIDKDDRMYYSDKTNRAIMRLNLNSTTANVIIENLQKPLSIACNKTTNQILIITDRGSNIEIWQL